MELLRLPHFVVGVGHDVLLEVEGGILQVAVGLLRAVVSCQARVAAVLVGELGPVRQVHEGVVGEPGLSLDLLVHVRAPSMWTSERVLAGSFNSWSSRATSKVRNGVRLVRVDDAVLAGLVRFISLARDTSQVTEARALQD